MGYCINYDTIPVKHESGTRRSYAKALAIFLFVFSCAVLGFFPQVRMALIRIIIPGFNADSAEALEVFAAQINDGAPFGDALHSFCVQIFSWMNG